MLTIFGIEKRIEWNGRPVSIQPDRVNVFKLDFRARRVSVNVPDIVNNLGIVNIVKFVNILRFDHLKI
jgi:hypothetical protein